MKESCGCEELRRRVAGLEKQARWSRVLALGALTLLGFLLLTGQDDPADWVVTAQAFHVVDEHGVTRAILSAGKAGASLVLLDEEGKAKGVLGTQQGSETFLALNYRESDNGVVLAPTGLVLRYEDGRPGNVIAPAGIGVYDGESQRLSWTAP
jgi:hypothetical protein